MLDARPLEPVPLRVDGRRPRRCSISLGDARWTHGEREREREAGEPERNVEEDAHDVGVSCALDKEAFVPQSQLQTEPKKREGAWTHNSI